MKDKPLRVINVGGRFTRCCSTDEVCDRLGFKLSAKKLIELGFEPAIDNNTLVLWVESEIPEMLHALGADILRRSGLNRPVMISAEELIASEPEKPPATPQKFGDGMVYLDFGNDRFEVKLNAMRSPSGKIFAVPVDQEDWEILSSGFELRPRAKSN